MRKFRLDGAEENHLPNVAATLLRCGQMAILRERITHATCLFTRNSGQFLSSYVFVLLCTMW